MIRQALLAALLLALTAGNAGAKDARNQPPFKTSSYPLEVRKTLSLGPTTCRDVEGGGKVGFARNTVRRVDVNGDGIKDYVVSFADTTCGGEKTGGFCGTGGCTVDFLVTLPNGRLRSLFVDQVHSYKMMRSGKVRFWIHHSYCGDVPHACYKDVRIGYRRFTPLRS